MNRNLRTSHGPLPPLVRALGLLSPLALLLLPLAALPLAAACGQMPTAFGQADAAFDEDGYSGLFATDTASPEESAPLGSHPTTSNADTGALHPVPATTAGTDAGDAEAEVDAATPDGAPAGACAQPPTPGDLVIDELMLESVAGAGDYGQWIEVASTVSCTLNLLGLHGECAKGSKVNTVDVTSDLWIPPGGTFLIADSSDPAVDHYLPGTLLVWFGQPGSVLRKEGGTVTLSLGSALIDSVTWPSLKPIVGASVSFPSNCAPAQRTDWSRWQTSTFSWFPGFFGTPNAPNNDVQCPP
jgi:hypothetical protein